MVKVIGVDFSGGGEDDFVGNTWVTEGLFDGKTLVIDHCRPMSRNNLKCLLKGLPDYSVAAMDFPFGVPKVFVEYMNLGTSMTMKDVWQHFASIDIKAFDGNRNRLVKERRKNGEKSVEPKRQGDAEHYPESLSPLNLRMRPMTFRGMRLLYSLHQALPARWIVPPLGSNESPAKCVSLLEVMPGAFLKAIGFGTIIKKYKGKDDKSLENRRYILENLSAFSGVNFSRLDDFRFDCLRNDDCLDSVVAAAAGACWAADRGRFLQPTPAELDDAQLEGWIYAPKRL